MEMIQEKIYHKAVSVCDAIRMATENAGNFSFISGGTDVWVNKFQGNNEKSCLIDINAIAPLGEVKVVGNSLSIGSLVTLAGLGKHDVIAEKFPALVTAALSVATPVLRRTATIGGNILCENRCSYFNQSEWWRESVGYCLKCEGNVCIATGGTKACFSKFVADTVPALICYDARIEVQDATGTHIYRVEDIYTGDGIMPRNLHETSIITSILLPLDKQFRCTFKKLRPRESADFTSLTTALSMDETGRVKVAVGGVDPKPVVTEISSMNERDVLINYVLRKSRLVDNDYYSRLYRKDMISVFLNQSFDALEK